MPINLRPRAVHYKDKDSGEFIDSNMVSAEGIKDSVEEYLNSTPTVSNITENHLKISSDVKNTIDSYLSSNRSLVEQIIDAYVEEHGVLDSAGVVEDVNAWLDRHPEATTTVEDGAISKAKLATDLLKRYNETGSVLYLFPDLSGGGYSGNCALIVTPTKTLLMDCGPTSDWDAIKDYFDGLYADRIFNNIDYVIISHYHYDHIQNLGNILEIYPHDGCQAYLPLNPAGYSTQDVSSNRASVISTLESNGVDYTEVSEETTITIDDNFTSLELFNSTVDDYAYYAETSPAIYNNFSMVALFKCGNVHAMFPGDIQRDAQIRIANTRTLPRLFLYTVHHHGIQNDDYTPYLEMINPEYSVIMTSHNRALLSSASSLSGNYLTGDVGSTGFSSYAYVSGKDGGNIIEGASIPKIGWYYSYIYLYVDNTYTGDKHDGTEEHPFTNINEAVMFVNQSSNLHYIICVKGTTERYTYTWLRDIFAAIEIRGLKGAANEYPQVDGMYIRNCTNIAIVNFTINGVGRSINDKVTLAYVWASDHVSFANCVFDGNNLNVNEPRQGVQLRESTVYLASCTIKNISDGINCYRYGVVTTNSVSFLNVSNCYTIINNTLYIRGNDTVSSCQYWIQANLDATRPFTISKNKISSALLALISNYAVSNPFYYNSNHPVCICQGPNIYDILTGEKVTLS